jgi:hypothetical protein
MCTPNNKTEASFIILLFWNINIVKLSIFLCLLFFLTNWKDRFQYTICVYKWADRLCNKAECGLLTTGRSRVAVVLTIGLYSYVICIECHLFRVNLSQFYIWMQTIPRSTNQHYHIYLATHGLPYTRLPELAPLQIHLENGNCNVCRNVG